MTKIAIALAAAAGFAFVSAPVLAADLVVYDDDLPLVTDVGTVEWEGPYIGGYIGAYPDDPSFIVGVQIGYNFLPAENFLIGFQASGQISPDGGYMEGWLDGRAGFVFDSVALYGIGGVGIFDDGTPLWRVGAGIEFMVADGFSLFAEGGLTEEFGDIPDNPYIQAGARFHF